MLTDRDIVVRCVAAGAIPEASTAAEVCSGIVAALKPDDDLDQAVEIMRARAIRRLPVVDHDHLIGVLSLGDLARVRDPGSALADISAASPTAV
jgi:CBS domain-containing protein